MTDTGIAENFAEDLPIAERRVLAATQGPTHGACFGAKIYSAAWRVKPSWYIVAAADRMIPPALERRFAAAMGAKTLEIASSHVPMLSHAGEVVDFIAEAAKR